ncbi:MAG TPA: DUF389 domain-containing protein [Streptosporangiaceae bacterium]|nr:DUF389 domain-containing protein [Streptosporangiaceae bacterium]
MLHVRVVCPAGQSADLLDTLSGSAGVRNLVLLPGAGRQPEGDWVCFDVHDGAANPVLHALRDLKLSHERPISVQRVDAVIGGAARRVGEIGSARREVAPVWEMVDATIRTGANYAPSFFVLMGIAGLIGAVGILTNSQILIVGAMVVGPEYTAIIATALGIANRERALVTDGLLALLYGFPAAIVLTLLFGLVIRWSGLTPAEFERGVRPVAALINSPNVFSVAVAVLAGIVGVVSLTESRANALIGVFISVTTIPAAASIGVSVAYRDWHEAWGSLLQLLLNVVLLIGVGAAGLVAQRVIWRRRAARSQDRDRVDR